MNTIRGRSLLWLIGGGGHLPVSRSDAPSYATDPFELVVLVSFFNGNGPLVID